MRTELAVAVLLALAVPATGHQRNQEAPLRDLLDQVIPFRLFNDCSPMVLVIEGVDRDAAAIGLTESGLRSVAESRLRSAGVYTEDNDEALFSYLYVNVNVAGPVFSMRLEYNKRVSDLFASAGPATTWKTGAAGLHGMHPDGILALVANAVDEFLGSYERANAGACGPE